MAITEIVVALLACGLVASALAYGELCGWHGVTAVALYGVAGLLASELAAAPAMWGLLGLRSGLIESLSMAVALGLALYHAVGLFVERGTDVS